MAIASAYTSKHLSAAEAMSNPPMVATPSTMMQPIILGPADSFPSPMTIRSPTTAMNSPTTMFLTMPDEDFLGFSQKRKRGNSQDNDDDDDGYITKFSHIDSPISASSPDEEDISNLEDYLSKRLGRKPMLDNDCLSQDMEHDTKKKRKAQNRAAQRAFRERKERYVKELETRIKQVQDSHGHATAQLAQENQHLRSIIYNLEAENFALKSIHIQFPVHSNPNPYYLFTPPTPSTTTTTTTTTPTMGTTVVAAAGAVDSPSYRSGPGLNHPLSSILAGPPLAPAPLLAPGPPPALMMAQQHPHQQQYTFSISTPATLRPKKSKEEQFIETVKQKVSNNAIEQLLSEPLFDRTGGLIRPPKDNVMASSSTLLTCPEIWKRLSKHTRFSLFTTQELCQEVGRRAKLSEVRGPVLDELDMEAILQWMSSKTSKTS